MPVEDSAPFKLIPRPASPEMVTMLENLLEDVRAGKIKAVGIATVDTDRCVNSDYLLDAGSRVSGLHFAAANLVHVVFRSGLTLTDEDVS